MKNYVNIYNNLINLTRNKSLYQNINTDETFSIRLMFYLIHFAFFLKIYKKSENKKKLQEIYDYNFRQLELSIREIGYGDVSINKKMKDYLNTFHKIARSSLVFIFSSSKETHSSCLSLSISLFSLK